MEAQLVYFVIKNVCAGRTELNEVKVAYTVSSKGSMIKDLINSLRSLRRFVKRSNIIVFYTPPRTELDYRQLARYALVEKVENLTASFVAKRNTAPSRYGEKIHICDIDSPNVIFLDADTTVRKDITKLTKGDFDFSARMAPANKDFNQMLWTSMFKEIGKEPIPMPNAGFMIFKNYCHQRIRKEWLLYMNDPLLPNPHPESNLKEQYALALAISGNKIKWMTAKEHRYSFEIGDTFVVHGEPCSFLGSRKLYEYKKKICLKSPVVQKIDSFIQLQKRRLTT
jgi:hypothetical protein